MKKLVTFFWILFLLSCNNGAPSKEELPSIPVENITATKDQKERRAKSEAYCKAHSIPVYKNPNALFPDAEDQVRIRTRDEVVDRALALYYLGLKSEGLEQRHLDQVNKDFNISPKLTAHEKAYATARQPAEQQNIDAGWKYEGLHIMLWALGFVDTLSYPDRMCDVAGDVKMIRDLTEKEFREKAKLRSKKEILDQADLALRLDWACVEARVKNEEAPGKLNKGVVFERHYALNWLINYMQQDWDDVTADT